MLKTGDQRMLHIEDITQTGEGVAKDNGFTVFVDDTIPGDTVWAEITQVKKNYAKGKCLKRECPSILRRTDGVECPYRHACGGCAFFDVDYHEQLHMKQKQIKEALERIGGIHNPPIEPVIGMGYPYHYRNKAQYKVCAGGLGFYKKGSHQVIPIDSCLTQPVSSEKVIKLVNRIIEEFGLTIYDEKTHKGLLRGVLQRENRNGQIMLVFIINGNRLPQHGEIIEMLSQDPDIVSVYLNINKNKGNRILGDKDVLLSGKPYLTEVLGDKTYQISPSSFFQVNSQQAEILYEVVRRMAQLKPGDTVYDLYCGTGTIGLYITEPGMKLYGIEINEQAVEDAKVNARLNEMDNAQFLAGKAEVITKDLDDEPNCIILDPPRKGCDKSLIDLLLEIKCPRIVYVSCNPASLARDLKDLKEEYDIVSVQPVDLFPMTGHVETVVLMSRVEK